MHLVIIPLSFGQAVWKKRGEKKPTLERRNSKTIGNFFSSKKESSSRNWFFQNKPLGHATREDACPPSKFLPLVKARKNTTEEILLPGAKNLGPSP